MIITLLISVITSVITTVFQGVNVPGLPDEAAAYIEQFIDLLDGAAGLFSLVFPVNVLPFIAICLGISFAHRYYAFVMWVLRKIPVLGIE